jgi:hypothetical protein
MSFNFMSTFQTYFYHKIGSGYTEVLLIKADAISPRSPWNLDEKDVEHNFLSCTFGRPHYNGICGKHTVFAFWVLVQIRYEAA